MEYKTLGEAGLLSKGIQFLNLFSSLLQLIEKKQMEYKNIIKIKYLNCPYCFIVLLL
ncbi:hypothetical protein LEP1GSC081_4299 [Leptospira kirschneri str. H1]|uniref:Uncharacterized protein n=1 Tax=Leptospira kirschneri str. H1 TaxID=1049966 RepID=A0A0E2BK31_9LEPT|nr:hypothetical protein LEP1GSC081_4299 [Leptospira kirschneri str. H1]